MTDSTKSTPQGPTPAAGVGHRSRRRRDPRDPNIALVIRPESIATSLYPTAKARGLKQALRVWYALRARDVAGAGEVTKSEAIAYLIGLGMSQRTVYRLLADGLDILWTYRTVNGRGELYGRTREIIVLTGAAPLFLKLGLSDMPKTTIEVPVGLLAQAGTWNALTYFSALPGPPVVRLTRGKDGLGAVVYPYTRPPIARATLRDLTAQAERTQRRHHSTSLPDQVDTLATSEANYSTDQEITPAGRKYQRRLGNTYEVKLPLRGYGRGRAFQREHADAVGTDTGSDHNERVRRFFEKASSLIRSRDRGIAHRDAHTRVKRFEMGREGLRYRRGNLHFWASAPPPLMGAF